MGNTFKNLIGSAFRQLQRFLLLRMHSVQQIDITGIYMLVYLVIYPGLGTFGGISNGSPKSQYEAEMAAAEKRFGNVFVGIQPAFGYEGDPMRLLFEHGFAPTHAFSAFYRWLREDFGAHAVLHFGTHGALEFMPGKQTGMSAGCWPDRLIGDLPNLYLYASNNPSEGTIAKRRAAATLISYLTPPVAVAGLYKGLIDLKSTLERWRSLPPEAALERNAMLPLLQSLASELELAPAEPAWPAPAERELAPLTAALIELETTLIPYGLHVVGQVPTPAERTELLLEVGRAAHAVDVPRAAIEALVAGAGVDAALHTVLHAHDATLRPVLEALDATAQLLAQDHELAGILHALDGGYLRPAPGGDLLHNPKVLPAGRNLHGFDPFRIPSTFAVQDGARQAERLVARHLADGNDFPESVALVLWGTDNLKSEGGPIAQALALLGARPRFDGYGRLAGAQLVPLEELGRPRVDVVITLSGIFRDLLPLQVKLLAEAAFLAASADEPEERNFVRKHALAYQLAHGGDMETAALRVFGNAEGAYGANVSHLVDCSRWDDGDELAETFTRRKGFAYGRGGRPVRQPALLHSVLAGVNLAYQSLDSVELGVTTIDTYFDTLGGISRAVTRAKRSEQARRKQFRHVFCPPQKPRGSLRGGAVLPGSRASLPAPDYAKPKPDPFSSGAQWGVTVYAPPTAARRSFLAEERGQMIELGPGSAHPGTTGEVRLELEGFLLAGDPHARGIIWDLAVNEQLGELYVLSDPRRVREAPELRVFDRQGKHLRTIMPFNPTLPRADVQDLCRMMAREGGTDLLVPKFFETLCGSLSLSARDRLEALEAHALTRGRP